MSITSGSIPLEQGEVTAGGAPLRVSLGLTKVLTDTGAVFYRLQTAWLQVEGSLQIFDRVQPVKILLQEFASIRSTTQHLVI